MNAETKLNRKKRIDDTRSKRAERAMKKKKAEKEHAKKFGGNV